MLFEKSNFDTIHTGKADPSRYLIIGFDTEYQRYADDETKTLNNEVLSYQYSCLIIEKDTEINDNFERPPLKWSDPIVRKTEDQRWPLRDPSLKRLS